jgi:hypothetical protein
MHCSGPLALAAALSCLLGDPAPQATGGVQVPGGIVDEASGIAYLGDLERGIVAIDADDGDLRWQSREGSRPLAIHQGRLLALKVSLPSFSIAVLDAGTGRLLRESASVPMRSFAPITGVRTHAWLTETSLNVHWHAAEQKPLGGTIHKDSLLSPYERGSAGVFAVDLDTGELETLPVEGAPLGFEPARAVPVNELPGAVRDLARSAGWELGVVAGGQVYGRSMSVVAESTGARTRHVEVHVFDLATARLVWSRAYEGYRLPPQDEFLRP